MICPLSMPSASTINNDFDGQIRSEVLAMLRRTGYIELPQLQVQVVGQAVYLKGRLRSYYLKQKTHYAALSVPGVTKIIDEIDVVS